MSRKRHLLEWEGKTWPLADLAIRYDLDYNILWQRLMLSKWPLEKALTEPVVTRNQVTPANRALASQIIATARQNRNVSSVAKLFQIQRSYVAFAQHGQRKPTGKPACPAWVIRQIIEIANQEGIKPAQDAATVSHSGNVSNAA